MVVVFVALSITFKMLAETSKQRSINRERAEAVAEIRNVIEDLRNQNFQRVYSLYNADPGDDPGGAGTAPGNRFAVARLSPTDDSPDGLHGEIFFPTFVDPIEGLQLRENLANKALGMPRDLNGDSIIDGADHSGDYFFLPVRIVVDWDGKAGPHTVQLHTQLCEYRKVER